MKLNSRWYYVLSHCFKKQIEQELEYLQLLPSTRNQKLLRVKLLNAEAVEDSQNQM